MKIEKKILIGLVAVIIFTGTVYFTTQVNSVVGGDAGDFLSAVATKGIPHPPGYPLFTTLAILIDNIFPFGSLAYKTAFLSTIPAIFSVVFLYLLLTRLTKKIAFAIISVLILSFSQLFWNYSIQVEVFSLNNFFLSTTLYFGYLFSEKGKIKYLYLVMFLLGLALTHHQMIIFLTPALIFVIFSSLKKLNFKKSLYLILYFSSGLIPYIYVYFSARSQPSINWMGEFNLSNFVALVTRSVYGTFVVGSFVGQTIVSRLINVLSVLIYIWQDFTLFPMIIIFSGFGFFYYLKPRLFLYIFTALISYLFFLFYASFPLSDSFMLATYERFLLPVFILLTVPLCFGMILCEKLLNKFFRIILPRFKEDKMRIVAVMIFAFIPFLLLIKNYRKFSELRTDYSAEHFAEDILSSAEKNAILIIYGDSPLFNSQYVYYTSKRHESIKLIQFSKLFYAFYIKQLIRDYPSLKINNAISGPDGLSELLDNNRDTPIYSHNSFNLEKGHFVPWGLIYKYFPENSKIDAKEVIKNNEDIWSKYHIPSSYSVFNNLIVNDQVRFYELSHQEIAFYEAKNGEYEFALNHLLRALELNPKNIDSHIILVQVFIKKNECELANKTIEKIREIDSKNITINYLKYLNFEECIKDKIEAGKFLKLYEEDEKRKETPLKKL